MQLTVGADVNVEFKGHRTAGEVVAIYKTSGYALVRIHIDPTWDYGRIGDDLDPEPFICVRQDKILPAEALGK